MKIIEEYNHCQNSDKSLHDLFYNVEKQNEFSSKEEKSRFLTLLLHDVKTKDWDEKVKTQCLSVVRTLGRDLQGSDPIFTKEGIEVLIQLAGLSNQPVQFKPTTTACEALKCIANCIYLKEETKVYLEQANTISACQFVLQSENQLGMDFQFLLCRILFFMTVNRHDIVEQLVRSNISQSIEKVLLDNIVQLENPVSRQAIDQRDPINAFTVTSEALKLLFNLMLVKARKSNSATIDDSTVSDGFKNCLVPIFHLLFAVPYAERQPLVPPHSQAIHALMQFPYTTIEQVWQSQAEWAGQLYDKKDDEHGYKFIATTFVDILDRAIHALIPQGDPDHDDVQQVDSIIAPLLLVLVSLAEGNSVLKSIMARSMLPGDKDRLRPVHEGRSLSAYLIRLMTSTMMPQTRDAACETLFVLCDKDANKFVQQVGYGNAVGYLLKKGIAIEPPQGDDGHGKDINPITGQYKASEPEKDLKDMTDEEKEREAERLFVLFERLKKTGIIDVENPIAKAMRESEGRFEEVDNESDSD